MAVDYEIMGERIKKARLAKGLKQDKVAEALNISIAYLSRIETGKTKVNLRRLNQLCKVLDVSESEILSGASDSTPNYLNEELGKVYQSCTPSKQKLIYKIASLIAEESED